MRILFAALLACVLAACGGTAAAPDDTIGAAPTASAPAASPVAPAASADAAPVASPAASQSAGGEAPEQVVLQVSQLLEQQFNVPAATITVQSAEPMEWSNSSLGCPEPGKFYTQTLVAGYLLTVSDGTQTYELHTNEDGSEAVVCENGSPARP